MIKDWKKERKVGFFAIITLLIIAYSTIKISEGAIFFSSGYDVHVILDTAIGMNPKTPVEIAGIQVGYVKEVDLAEDGRRALATLRIDRDEVFLPEGTTALVKSKGFLGDTFIELMPGPRNAPIIEDGGQLKFGGVGGDMNILITKFIDIADDVKAVSESMRDLIAPENSPFKQTMKNLERFTETMRELVNDNQKNINQITQNFAAVSADMRDILVHSRDDVTDTTSRVASIARKIDEGRGSVGKLVNDEATVDKLNKALDSLDGALGGFNKLQTELGYHTEYLAASKEFKHYIHFDLWPRPDQAFMFEFVEDRSPAATRVTRTTQVTSGGSTSTVTSDVNTVDRDRFLISAQLAKRLYDFTLRGGIIESSGGVGIDYNKGVVDLSFSAFEFNTQQGNKPHLKVLGQVNVTPSLYVVGGADDFINPNQSTDWFVGAGLRLRDEDIKSLLTAGGLNAALGK